MKSLISKSLLVLLSFAIISCDQIQEKSLENVQKIKESVPEYTVVVIDGCEYLRLEHTHGYASLTHKGNCKNPIHIYNGTKTSPQNPRH